MTNIMEINEHCRLCLVKDEVNIPIFEDEGDVRQVLLKITACLPVKIAKADSLPKRICDGCLYKLESFYQFWNTSVNSEKQLLQWLSETLNGDAESNLHALKQEPADNLQTESQVFIQQQLAYQDTENYGEFNEETNYKPKKSTTKKEREREKRERVRERKREEAEEEEAEEAPAPKRKRRAATKKPAIEIDDDDDDEEYVPPSAAVTKTEDDSEANDDPGDDYGADDNASDDNLDDETEPGPSGTTKSSTDAPRSAWSGRVAAKKKLYSCKLCPRQYTSRSSYSHHVTAHSDVPIQCPTCARYLKNKTTYQEHMRRHKDPSLKTCQICSKQIRNLHNHMKRRHLQPERRFQCDQCEKLFYTKKEVEMHVSCVHTVTEYKCEQCDKVFTNKAYYLCHVANHKANLTCPHCGKVSVHLYSFRAHLKKCSGFEPVRMCDICGKQVTTAYGLRLHKRTHTGEKPYECYQCGKSFTREQLLKTHMRVHTRERPFVCSYCAKGFTQKSSLTIHIRMHTGERPYSCHVCENTFASRTLLNAHLKNHAT